MDLIDTATLGESCANLKGYYKLENIFNESQNIMYLDFATNSYNYLCFDISCIHDNSNCTSYVEMANGDNYQIACTEEQLILATAITPQNDQPNAYVMNLDGSEKKSYFIYQKDKLSVQK